MSELLRIAVIDDKANQHLTAEIMQGDGFDGASYTVIKIDDGKKEHSVVLDLMQTQKLGFFLTDGVRTEHELTNK
jgi:hypothetical protein